MTPTSPSSISRSGLKYWLEPDGTLYQTEEHSVGAKRWGMMNLDDVPPTFGVSDLMARGWVRLVTEKSTIWVTGGNAATSPSLTASQKKTLREVSDTFLLLNGVKPDVKVGDGVGSSPLSIDASPILKREELKGIPSFYKRGGTVSMLGDSVQRFLAMFR